MRIWILICQLHLSPKIVVPFCMVAGIVVFWVIEYMGL